MKMAQDKPNSVVVFDLLDKNDAEKVVKLSKQFSPAYQITNHFICGKCKIEIFAVDYLKKCPECKNFLWTNAEHEKC